MKNFVSQTTYWDSWGCFWVKGDIEMIYWQKTYWWEFWYFYYRKWYIFLFLEIANIYSHLNIITYFLTSCSLIVQYFRFINWKKTFISYAADIRYIQFWTNNFLKSNIQIVQNFDQVLTSYITKIRKPSLEAFGRLKSKPLRQVWSVFIRLLILTYRFLIGPAEPSWFLHQLVVKNGVSVLLDPSTRKDKKECKNYLGISVSNVAYKILSTILYAKD